MASLQLNYCASLAHAHQLHCTNGHFDHTRIHFTSPFLKGQENCPWRRISDPFPRRKSFSSQSLTPAVAALKQIEHAAYGVLFDDVPHLTDTLPDIPTYPSPLKTDPDHETVKSYFVDQEDIVTKNVVVKISAPGEGIHFRRAGPREKVYFRPEEVRACVVTCGGLCPGLNTVIREIVCGLWNQYGVRDIIGIEGGYQGFYSRNTKALNPKIVNDIHKRGGTILGTSRGGNETVKIVNSIEDRGINQVYIIGGDGTLKGADVIYEEITRRGLKVVVSGIPKTIDNDIAVIDKSFGFDTAVEEAQRAINAAHTEAESAENGIGLVKLMGRYSGYIAMYATLASRDVDCCLIPEVPFHLEGEGGLYEFVEKNLRANGHMVIVVAEGAGQELMADSISSITHDASGNQSLHDIGIWLSEKFKHYFKNIKKQPLNLKYIDPTYMIRAIPSNASDNIYCTLLAHSTIHGAMAGYTGFTVGPVNGRNAYIPTERVTKRNRVNITDRMWARLLSSTNQPEFLHYGKATEAGRKTGASESLWGKPEGVTGSSDSLQNGNGFNSEPKETAETVKSKERKEA